MLEELTIRNYALIDSITLSFRHGFNVLTGETGAGKSIIVGSLSFLLGAKAETDIIRSGCDEANVSATLTVNENNTEVIQWLKSRDIESEDQTVIVRRNIKTSGRGSIYIQNIPVTRQDLSEFMALLFDLHGQHNHESLLRKESHRRYLDSFIQIENEVQDFTKTFLELTEKRKVMEASLKDERDREDRLELLRYAVDEIEKASIKIGEIRDLENEMQKLSDFEKLAMYINTAALCFNEGENSTLSLLRRFKNSIDSAVTVDSSLGELSNRVESLYYEAEDISGEFRSYRDNLTYDPKRLEIVNDRLALLYKLKKKYSQKYEAGTKEGRTESGEEVILGYKTNAENEITALNSAEENREKLKSQISVLEKTIVSKAKVIREKREGGAEKLGKLIIQILQNLGMPNAGFLIKFYQRSKMGRFLMVPGVQRMLNF